MTIETAGVVVKPVKEHTMKHRFENRLARNDVGNNGVSSAYDLRQTAARSQHALAVQCAAYASTTSEEFAQRVALPRKRKQKHTLPELPLLLNHRTSNIHPQQVLDISPLRRKV